MTHKEAVSTDIVKVYNTFYDDADHVIKIELLAFSSHGPTIKIIPMQKQTIGSNNCGVFAVEVCAAILLKKDPSHDVFYEDKIRSHLSVLML